MRPAREMAHFGDALFSWACRLAGFQDLAAPGLAQMPDSSAVGRCTLSAHLMHRCDRDRVWLQADWTQQGAVQTSIARIFQVSVAPGEISEGVAGSRGSQNKLMTATRPVLDWGPADLQFLG